MKSEERLEIARECFSLGLRLLSFYARLVVDHRTELHDGLVSLLRAKREHMQPDEAKHLADKFILGLAEFFGFAVIKHLSSSVGTQRLSETFGDLFKQKRDSAHQLIDLSIKLDNYQSFPIDETEDLSKKVRGNTFAWSLLRRFIWQHFYLHDEDYKLTQRACSLVEIAYERTHYLPPTTKREK